MNRLPSIKNRLKRSLIFVSVSINIIVFVFVFTPLTNELYGYLEVTPEIKKADAIILLSSESYAPNVLGQNTLQRMLQALSLYKEGYANKIIVCGGVLEKGGIPIALDMKNVLVKMGVDEKDIITEDNSQNTYENISNLAVILRSMGVKKSLLVTSSYHMFRSLAICKRLGVEVFPAPVPCYEKDVHNVCHRVRFVPEIIREYMAITYFWFKGWI